MQEKRGRKSKSYLTLQLCAKLSHTGLSIYQNKNASRNETLSRVFPQISISICYHVLEFYRFPSRFSVFTQVIGGRKKEHFESD